MNKKDKYYNYIADDMVKDTDVDFEVNVIELPWLGFYIPITTSSFGINYTLTNKEAGLFRQYLIAKYGVLDDDMVDIYRLYSSKLESKYGY